MGTDPGKPPSLLLLQGAGTLLERDAELEVVDNLLARACDRRGSLLIVDGPAGIGKSRLLTAAHELGRARRFEVLRARGAESERALSYGVVRQLFEMWLAARETGTRATLLGGAARAAAPLFEPAETGPRRAEEEDAAFEALHGLFWLTVNVAETGPLLISVDDLQWCDRMSLRFLVYLARRLDGLPLVVAGALRTGEPDVDAIALAELEAEPHATVRPAPLSRNAVRELLQTALAGDPAAEFVRAVHAACGGNPLFVGELIQAARAEGLDPTASAAARVAELGPETLVRSVSWRIRRVGASAEALARAVAVLGEDCELSLAAQLAGLDTEEAGAAAAALARAGILSVRGPLRFAHPVLRAAVHGELGDVERSLAHGRAAELLTARGARAQQIAVHLLHAPPEGSSTTVATLRDAARQATREGAADTAVMFLERALAEPPERDGRGEVLLELGVAETRAGARAIAHLEAADQLLMDTPRSADAVIALSDALYADGRPHDSVTVLRDRIERFGADAGGAQRVEAYLLGRARFDAEFYPMVRDRLAAISQDLRGDTPAAAYLLVIAASELARAGASPARAHDLVHRALAGPLRSHESEQPYFMALAVLLTLDHLDAAARGFTAWLDDRDRRGRAFGAVRAWTLRALAMLRRGELAEAEADARTAIDAERALASERTYPMARAFLVDVLAERGRIDEALAALGPVAEGEVRRRYDALHPLELRARLRIAAGDRQAGLADLLEVGRHLEMFGVRNPSYSSWRSSAALILHRLGDTSEARRLVDEELELARAWEAPRPIGTALRVAGLLEPAGAGLEQLRASVEVLGDSPALLERAKSLTELGAALRRANRRAEARAPLREALELAQRCHADPVVKRAHTELLATGARPRRVMRTGVDSLTPSERRVAQMAADGQTNREIAQTLFVTPKTVEMHLSNVYRKLEITARSQLPRALGEH